MVGDATQLMDLDNLTLAEYRDNVQAVYPPAHGGRVDYEPTAAVHVPRPASPPAFEPVHVSDGEDESTTDGRPGDLSINISSSCYLMLEK